MHHVFFAVIRNAYYYYYYYYYFLFQEKAYQVNNNLIEFNYGLYCKKCSSHYTIQFVKNTSIFFNVI